MKTLLEKAITTHTKTRASKLIMNKESVDLAIAWAKGEVRLIQVSKALYGENTKPSTYGGKTLYWLATAFREGFRQGLIRAVKKI